MSAYNLNERRNYTYADNTNRYFYKLFRHSICNNTVRRIVVEKFSKGQEKIIILLLIKKKHCT